jgi:hypothetical protein
MKYAALILALSVSCTPALAGDSMPVHSDDPWARAIRYASPLRHARINETVLRSASLLRWQTSHCGIFMVAFRSEVAE